LSVSGPAVAEEISGQYLGVAEIEIDPTQLENCKRWQRSKIDAAIREESGVLVLYSVAEEADPAKIIVFEINLSRRECVRVASGNRTFQEIQGHNREDGQVAQAHPNNPHCTR
jgi:hypothetical protein